LANINDLDHFSVQHVQLSQLLIVYWEIFEATFALVFILINI